MVGTAPNPSDCILYYKFLGDATDSTTNSNDGTNNGATISSTGGIIAGRAIFDGLNDFISTGGNIMSAANQDWSICFWFKFDDYTRDAGQAFAAYDHDATGNSENFTLFFDGRSAASPEDCIIANLDRTGNENQTIASAGSIVSDNNWHFLVYSIDHNNTHEIFLDNVQIATGSVNGGFDGIPTTSGVNFLLGAANTEVARALYLDGDIAEVSIFNKYLTADERTFLYNGGSPTTEQQYPFTQGQEQNSLFTGCNF